MKVSKQHFLWPKVKFNFSSFFGFNRIDNTEKELHKMFPSGYPVLCSSGRVALYIAINESNLDRSKKINLYPYASHCVLNTIGRLTNPNPYMSENQIDIIYHQWGVTFNCNHKPLIEDSVDSLYERNTPLFQGGAKFEIWSLPKILGTTSGGILWCKKEKDAILIRSKINNKKGIIFSWILRLLSYKFSLFYSLWEGTEKGYKGLSRLQINEIFSQIKLWDKVVENRKEKLDIFKKYSILNDNNLGGRLPSCLPVKTNISENKLDGFGFSTGIRHFLTETTLEKVFPLPIHQDVSISSLNNLFKNGG